MKRLGLIARADNSGLGNLSWEFFKNLPITKTLIISNGIYRTFPERFPGARIASKPRTISKEDLDWLLQDIDVLLILETPYEENIIRTAQKRNIKVALIPMYECTPPFSQIGMPDMILCPSKLDFEFYKRYRERTHVTLLPTPVNRTVLPFAQKKIAKTFLHVAGHGGLGERNGTSELLAAIPMIKNKDVLVLINSQRPIAYSHPQVEIKIGNFRNYYDLYKRGDVFVFPHKFAGLSLPIQEAMSVGMPVLTTAIKPFSTWLPTNWLIPADHIIQTKVSNTVVEYIDYAIVKPEMIAAKIDDFAGNDISHDSHLANMLAGKISWEKLKADYITTLCRQ